MIRFILITAVASLGLCGCGSGNTADQAVYEQTLEAYKEQTRELHALQKQKAEISRALDAKLADAARRLQTLSNDLSARLDAAKTVEERSSIEQSLLVATQATMQEVAALKQTLLDEYNGEVAPVDAAIESQSRRVADAKVILDQSKMR